MVRPRSVPPLLAILALSLTAIASAGACAASSPKAQPAAAAPSDRSPSAASATPAAAPDGDSLLRADASGQAALSEAELLEVAQRRVQRLRALRGELLERLGRAQALGQSDKVRCLERAVETIKRLTELAQTSTKRLEEAIYRRFSAIAEKQAALVQVAHERARAIDPEACGPR